MQDSQITMKISAGFRLNHKNPNPDPNIPQKTVNSPHPETNEPEDG